MKNYRILNMSEVNRFVNSAILKGETLTAIKGKAPIGAMYSDGDLITNPVNIAWLNEDTGESVDVIYALKQPAKGGE